MSSASIEFPKKRLYSLIIDSIPMVKGKHKIQDIGIIGTMQRH